MEEIKLEISRNKADLLIEYLRFGTIPSARQGTDPGMEMVLAVEELATDIETQKDK